MVGNFQQKGSETVCLGRMPAVQARTILIAVPRQGSAVQLCSLFSCVVWPRSPSLTVRMMMYFVLVSLGRVYGSLGTQGGVQAPAWQQRQHSQAR